MKQLRHGNLIVIDGKALDFEDARGDFKLRVVVENVCMYNNNNNRRSKSSNGSVQR